MNIISHRSLLAVPITIKGANGQPIGNATGCFWRGLNDRTYLISNFHVFSGNHYLTNASMNRDSAFPVEVEYPRFVNRKAPQERTVHSIRLCDAAGNDPTWFRHPIHAKQAVDVAAVEVPTIGNDESFVFAVNDAVAYECDLPLPYYGPGFEMLLVGFFLQDRPTGYFPMSIRGFVASEMHALYHGRRAFLIDAQTSAGMSGSPVFATGLDQHERGDMWSDFKTTSPFVGVYSGRIIEGEGGKKRELQVGVVWRKELVKELIDVIPLA